MISFLYNIYNKASLTPLIFDSKDFEILKYYYVKPNFITNKIIRSEIVNLNASKKNEEHNLKGKIIVIENADPGYDWIFTRGIKGLITKYGGAASHMAIRETEFSIPAVIVLSLIHL